jgi:hypothetical protein
MPNYRGEIKCELRAPALGEVTSETSSGKFSDTFFDAKTGKILTTDAKAKTEAKPLVEACRKLLAAPPM